MMPDSNKSSFRVQFSVKFLLVTMLVVAAFMGGRLAKEWEIEATKKGKILPLKTAVVSPAQNAVWPAPFKVSTNNRGYDWNGDGLIDSQDALFLKAKAETIQQQFTKPYGKDPNEDIEKGMKATELEMMQRLQDSTEILN